MDNAVARFTDQVERESIRAAENQDEYNFVEITRLPKKMDGRSLTSLIVSASQILPKGVDICIKKDENDRIEQVALVEFKSERDAHGAVSKVKLSLYGRHWMMRIIKSPKYSGPESLVSGEF